MTAFSRRRIAIWVCLFALLLPLGGWPWAKVQSVFSAIYCPAANFLMLDRWTFGKGGHAHLAALAAPAVSDGDNVVSDANLILEVARYSGDIGIGVSTRRDAYLPLLLVVAVVAPAPLSARRKITALLIGFATIFGLTLACLFLLVLWTFAVSMNGVYEPSWFWKSAVDLAFRTLLLPPANRFLVPAAIGLGIVLKTSSRIGRKDKTGK